MHSKASLCDQQSPVAIGEVGQAAAAQKLTDDVVIVVDNENNPDKDTTNKKPSSRGKTIADQSSESVVSSSLATSASEQPHQQNRRRFSNISNLALSLPSTTLSSSMSGGVFDADAPTTTGGSLDHVSGIRKRHKLAGGGTRSRDGSHCNSSDILRARHKNAADRVDTVDDRDSGNGVVCDEIQGRVRRTRSALETGRGAKAGAFELVAGDCDSLSEEIASKSPLLVQREKSVEGHSQPKEERQLEAHHRPLGSRKYQPFPTKTGITTRRFVYKRRLI